MRVNFLLIYLHGTPCWGIPGVWEFTMIVCGWDVTEEELNDTDCFTKIPEIQLFIMYFVFTAVLLH